MNKNIDYIPGSINIAAAQSAFLSRVYAWMVGGLLITTVSAWFVTTSEEMLSFTSSFFWVLALAEIGLVIWLSGWIAKMSKQTAIITFLAYSLLNGLTIGLILYMYTDESIVKTFLTAAGMFAALSFFGFVTKKSLSGLGSFLYVGLIGLVIASLIAMFFQSSGLNFAISVIGVLIFAGLTAYDTQRLKEMYQVQLEGDEIAAKGAILGALMLYLDFINLFLFLLRLWGDRR